uniref:Uncharacterized protein n=1 Tax=Chromera velia CCMP2878 TaxID=1169474 RepID=A0A0K6S5W6_9ALVE|eukprot:Cvel_14206.t1-p1 / transcript=Cvel_14206.t1 / gene=Cvel_14206 / organism=Chromera_velia_CCMP2878 / gene_product=hypothetical protein / transcript_product=hypothetical protein / location=Cvel_scaffold1001:54638-56626(-) / protein_length=444 / sequence_SO=supercontig / SO=protein_coding / is_pseudo=false
MDGNQPRGADGRFISKGPSGQSPSPSDLDLLTANVNKLVQCFLSQSTSVPSPTPTPTTDMGKFAPWKCELSLPFKNTHGGRVTIVKAFEDYCKLQLASAPSDIRAAAFSQGLQKYPELYDLVSDLSPLESDDVEHYKNIILQLSGETEHKRMFTNFRSLFTLSTSDSPNVEKYMETVKAACQKISRLSLQEEIVPVWSGAGDKTDLSTWRVEKKLNVPLLDPLIRRQGQLASLVLINGISDSTVRANVKNSIASHMPFDRDDGALTGHSSTGHPRPRVSGPSRKRPHCEQKTHRPEECLKQHYCSDCDHWGHKTGDYDLACDHFALLRAYGYSGGGANDLFFLPLEIDGTSPPEFLPALNSPSVSPAAVAVDAASPVSPPLSLSPVVLANGHLPARLKAAKQKKQHRGNRTQSHVVKTYSGESAVSPPVSSSCDSSPASDQPPS